MSELEDKIQELLQNPKELERIAEMAKSLMGGGTEEGDTGAQEADLGLDANMLASVGRLLKRFQGEKDDKHALLEAMKPYLREDRQKKMERAMKIAKMARIAGIAFSEYGGDRDGL